MIQLGEEIDVSEQIERDRSRGRLCGAHAGGAADARGGDERQIDGCAPAPDDHAFGSCRATRRRHHDIVVGEQRALLRVRRRRTGDGHRKRSERDEAASGAEVHHHGLYCQLRDLNRSGKNKGRQ